jgi:hypothetical protein
MMTKDDLVSKDTALKIAIEALNTLMIEKGSIYQQAINACKEALQQPAQKPVVWQWLKSGHMRKKIPKTATPEHWRPLYTHPHQWQALTDNEKLSSIRKWAENNTMRGQELIGLCDSIEKALKDKNT